MWSDTSAHKLVYGMGMYEHSARAYEVYKSGAKTDVGKTARHVVNKQKRRKIKNVEHPRANLIPMSTHENVRANMKGMTRINKS